jgi:hypothetical protein
MNESQIGALFTDCSAGDTMLICWDMIFIFPDFFKDPWILKC